jgi:hypothetical protein
LTNLETAFRTALGRLLDRYGFNFIEAEPHAIRFESHRVSLTFFHGSHSFELGLIAVLKEWPDQRFSLQDVVDAAGGTESAFFQASTSDRLLQCVASLTRLLEIYGDGMFRGDVPTFNRMAEVSARRSEALTKEVINRPIRVAAESGWKAKNYAQVKRLYDQFGMI